MAPRTRYPNLQDVAAAVGSRMKAGLSPDAALARDAQLGSAVGAAGHAAGMGAAVGQNAAAGATGVMVGNAAGGPATPQSGGTAADLGIRTNNGQGNPRSGQDFRAFMGGDGLEHHVYAGGEDIAVKPRGTDASRLAQFQTALAAREGAPAPNTGQNPPPGPQDTSGQRQAMGETGAPDLSAVAALPPEQQQALMQLASAAAAQSQRNQANPALSQVLPKPARRAARL